jgi:hypothetical protein
MEYLIGILIIVLLVRWVMLSGRLKDIEEQLARTVSERGWSDEQFSALTKRVHDLELAGTPLVGEGAELCFCGAVVYLWL